MSDGYDEVAKRLRHQLGDQTRIRLQSSVDPAIGQLAADLGVDSILLNQARLHPGRTQMSVTGRAGVFGTRAAVKLAVVDGAPVSTSLELSVEGPTEIRNLVGAEGPLSRLASEFAGLTGGSAALNIEQLTIRAVSPSREVTVTATVTAPISLQIAGRPATLTATASLQSSVDATGTRTNAVALTGSLQLGSLRLHTEVELSPGGRRFESVWQAGQGPSSLLLSDLIESLGLEMLGDIPSSFDVQLEQFSMRFDTDADEVRIHAQSSQPGGILVTVARGPSPRGTATWHHSVEFEFEPGTQPSAIPVLGSELQPFDALTFNSLSIGVSSHDRLQRRLGPPLAAGLNITGSIALSASPDGSADLSGISTLLAHDSLVVSGSLAASGVLLHGVLNGPIDLGGGVALERPSLNLTLSTPPRLDIGGLVILDLGEQILTWVGRASISAEGFDGAFNLEGRDASGRPLNLLEPLGITGLTMSEVGLGIGATFAPPRTSLALSTRFGIGDQRPDTNELGVELEVSAGVVPIVRPLAALFELNTINLATIVDTFTDVTLTRDIRSLLANIEGSGTFSAASRTTVLPNGSIVDAGFRFDGTLSVLGRSASASLAIDQATGIAGSLDLPPIEFTAAGAPVVRILRSSAAVSEPDPSGTGGRVPGTALTAGPSFRFDTRGPTIMSADIEVELFGLARVSAIAEVGTDGMTFEIEVDVGGGATAELQCTIGSATSPGFAARASFALDLDVDIPIVIDVPLTDDDIVGSLHLDSEIAVVVAVSARADECRLTIDGHFGFEGANLALPQLELAVPLGGFSEVADRIVSHLLDRAANIFASVFDDLEKTWNDVTADIEAGAAQLTEALETMATDTAAEVERIGAAAEQAIDAVIDDVEALAAEAESVIEAGVAAVNDIATGAAAFVDDVADDVSLVVERAGQEIAAVGEAVKEFVDDVADGVATAAAAAVRMVGQLLAEAADLVEQIAADAAAFARDIAAEAERIAKAIEVEAAKVHADAERAWADLGAELERLGRDIEDGWNDMWDWTR